VLLALVNNYSLDKGFEYCKFLPLEFKENCYDSIGEWIIMLHPLSEQREKECSKAENADYSKICIDASLDNMTLIDSRLLDVFILTLFHFICIYHH
jgi:hypothetical protein